MGRPHGRVRFRPHIAGRCTRRRRGGACRRRGGPVVHVASGSRRSSRARRAKWPLGAESIGRRRGKPRRRWGPMSCRGQPARRAPVAARRRYVRHYRCAGAAYLSPTCPHGIPRLAAWNAVPRVLGGTGLPDHTRTLPQCDTRCAEDGLMRRRRLEAESHARAGVGSGAPSSVSLVTHAVQFRTLCAQ